MSKSVKSFESISTTWRGLQLDEKEVNPTMSANSSVTSSYVSDRYSPSMIVSWILMTIEYMARQQTVNKLADPVTLVINSQHIVKVIHLSSDVLLNVYKVEYQYDRQIHAQCSLIAFQI